MQKRKIVTFVQIKYLNIPIHYIHINIITLLIDTLSTNIWPTSIRHSNEYGNNEQIKHM